MLPPPIAGTGAAVCSPRNALSLTGGDMTGVAGTTGTGKGTTISASLFNSSCSRVYNALSIQ